jgi:chemotaxis protein histidine kinase CheA
VLNLLVNAAQAVASNASRPGEIRVASRVAAGAVLIEVSDTGPGIDPALLDKIFKPFFTTKPAGAGTGLGLGISRDIVHEMGGTLTVQSVLGRGSTFRISLPVAGIEVHAPASEHSDFSISSGSVRRILVIDDEPMIGRMVRSACRCTKSTFASHLSKRSSWSQFGTTMSSCVI